MNGTCPLVGMHLARDKQKAKVPGVLIEGMEVGDAGKGAVRAGVEGLGEAAETAGVRGGAVPLRETDGRGAKLRQAETAGAPQAEAVRARPEVHPLTVSLAVPICPLCMPLMPRENIRAESFLDVPSV